MPHRAAVALAALTCLLPAQETVPTFTTTTRLVELSFVAVDRKGAPVTDLKKDEIQVLEAAVSRPVAFFRFEGGTPPPPRPLGKNTFSNRLELSSGPSRNVTAVLLDSLNTAVNDQPRTRAQVMRFLRRIPPGARVGVYQLGREMRIVHDFTDDVETLQNSLAKASIGHRPQEETDLNSLATEYEAVASLSNASATQVAMIRRMLELEGMANQRTRMTRVEATLSSLLGLGRHLSAIPGRKNLVWVTGGLPWIDISGSGMGPMSHTVTLREQLESASRRLAEWGIALYIVDAKGIVAPEAGPQEVARRTGRGVFQTQNYDDFNKDIRLSMNLMASITGGRFINYTNDAADGVREAARDVEGSYSLGFYTPQEPDGKWHGVKLATTRDGVRLIHRDGYRVEKPSGPKEWKDTDWRALLASPEVSRAIPITAFAEFDEKKETLLVQAQLDTKGILFTEASGHMTADLDVCVGETSLAGRVRYQTEGATLKLTPENWQLVRISGVPWARQMKPDITTERIRVVIRDRRTGEYGSIDIPLRALRVN
ncbi:MAG: VWA domain-containing protein [Bryobacteraceae bacterium]|nr:VWA domain-containing protein [Bryobacteraceae bacterium]